jgi:hypothetical protein
VNADDNFEQREFLNDTDATGPILKVHRRTLVAEGRGGSLAVFPPRINISSRAMKLKTMATFGTGNTGLPDRAMLSRSRLGFARHPTPKIISWLHW